MSLATAIAKARGAIQAARGVAVSHPRAAGAAIVGGAAAAGYAAGEYDRPMRRRRSRGISARDFRTTQRTLRKISRMYQKLPRRASHATRRSYGAGRKTEIVNVD